MRTIDLDDLPRLAQILDGRVTPVRQAFKHTHPLSLAHPPFLDLVLPRDCQACRVERRLRNVSGNAMEYEPFMDGSDPFATHGEGYPDFAPYVRLAWCDDHGMEPVTGERIYRTGHDSGSAGEFACGAVVKEDVF